MPSLRLWGNQELDKLKRDMNRLFESLCTDFGLPGAFGREGVKVEENQTEIRVCLTVPGLQAEDLAVKVDDFWLEITGRSEETVAGSRNVQTFTRRFGLPCRVRPGEVRAVFRDGALEILLPKCSGDQCRSIDIVKE
ncbi:MAG: Hsp20/alpha crystallin family protein [Desulfovibrionaceae bacterium]